MAAYNKTILVGRLTKDPEVSLTKNDKTMARSTLAVNRIGAPEGQQQADFVNLMAFGKTAELMREYTSKGSLLMIEGRLCIDEVTTEGERKWFTKVLVSNVQFLDSKKDTSTGYTETFAETSTDQDNVPF